VAKVIIVFKPFIDFVALTGKPIGSEYVTKFEPTDLPVGALKNK
jgi:hypothetical protein